MTSKIKDNIAVCRHDDGRIEYWYLLDGVQYSRCLIGLALDATEEEIDAAIEADLANV